MYKGIIYKATSPSKKIYYGKTGRILNVRINEHKIKSKIEKKHFYLAIKKYGIDNFEWETIEKFQENTEEKLTQILNERETYWIKKDRTYLREFGYNMTLGGEGTLGLKRAFSKEHKKKLSEAKKGKKLSKEHKKKISESEKGRIFPNEVKRKISESKKGVKNPMYRKGYLISGEKNGMFGKTHSIETKNKLSEISKNVKKLICEHCGKEFTPWGIVHHNKKIIKNASCKE
jgi:group I intron endonuclease